MATEPARGVDAASLGAFRIVFGLLMLLAVLRYFASGWIDAQFVEPTFFFPYAGLEWIRPLPAPWMHVLFGIAGGAALFVALGLFYRVAIVVFTGAFTWIHFSDQTNYLNHYWLVTLLGVVMVFLPMHAAFSLDARRRPDLARPRVPRAYLYLLRFQIACVYVFAGIAKIGHDWLVRGEPLRTWFYGVELHPTVDAFLRQDWVIHGASWAALLFDLLVPFLALWRRTRVVAFVLIVGFHLATSVLFPIGLFPFFMIAFATIFLPPGWPRRFLRRTPTPTPEATSSLGVPLAAKLAIGAWVVLQLALPLRASFESGNVHWHERGFRFSWRVMLIDKIGTARFHLHDPTTGERWEVEPEDELTPLQARMMAIQPDMILTYAKHLGARARSEGHAQIEVRVHTHVSLNSRPGRPLIDPERDLLQAGDAIPPAWIVALPEGR